MTAKAVDQDLSKLANGLSLGGDEEGAEKLVIALDFGTTFSGIAFCFASHRDPKVVSILDWPGKRPRTVAPAVSTRTRLHC